MTDPLPFLPISEPYIGETEAQLVAEALQSGWISSLGPNLEAFEKSFAQFCGTDFAVTVSNGTTALHLTLEALGIGPGDEVIVPDLTFVATANAVVHTGAVPVIVDVDPLHLCLDPQAFERAITPRTKAVIPVHLYGHPAQMDEINTLAKKNNVFVVEDAAEAHGALWRGKRVGSLGVAGVFSFYGNKIVTTGEGGMVTTNDPALAKKLRFYRDHAMSPEKRYFHPEIGWNYRMTNIQAAIGLAQMGRVEHVLQRRHEIYERYRSQLGGVSELRFRHDAEGAKSVCWLVCAELEDPDRRTSLFAGLKELGIDSRPYFYPLSDMPMYRGPQCPIAKDASRRGFNLPTSYQLTNDSVDRVCLALRTLLKS